MVGVVKLKLKQTLRYAGLASMLALVALASTQQTAQAQSSTDNEIFQALLAHAQLTLKAGNKAEAIQLFTIAQNSPVPHLDSDPIIAHGLRKASALPDTAQSATV